MNSKITDMNDSLGHRKRVKQKFIENGLDAFQDYEALELLLFYSIPRRDTKAAARLLLREFGSIRGVLSASYEELIRLDGIGHESAVLLSMFPGLLARYHRPGSEKQSIGCTEDAVKFTSTLFFGRQTEALYIICLNVHNRVIKYKKIADGGIQHIDLEIRSVIEAAIFYKAARIILAHNHPGDNLTPSKEDICLNNDISAALSKIDIPLLDHIIIGESGGYSMRLNRLIETDFYAAPHKAAEKELE